jgi:hypothetical protein
VEALGTRAGELSRGWAIAQLEQHAPEQMGEVPIAALAAHGPGLIIELAAALASDSALDQLALQAQDAHSSRPAGRGRGVLWPGTSEAGAVMAAEALRGVLWEATLAELREPSAREVAELSDRIAYLCSLLAACWASAGPSAGPSVGPAHGMVPVEAEASDRRSASRREELALIVDEHVDEREGEPMSGIEIRDERQAQPRHWLDAIERRLERFERDRKPFAVLLAEVTESERPEGWHGHASEVRSRAELVVDAFGRELGPMDHLTEELPGRCWLVVPEADTLSARRLAERLAQAARTAIGGGSPLRVAVGIALCPDHGLQATALCAHAEVDVYAARRGLSSR